MEREKRHPTSVTSICFRSYIRSDRSNIPRGFSLSCSRSTNRLRRLIVYRPVPVQYSPARRGAGGGGWLSMQHAAHGDRELHVRAIAGEDESAAVHDAQKLVQIYRRELALARHECTAAGSVRLGLAPFAAVFPRAQDWTGRRGRVGAREEPLADNGLAEVLDASEAQRPKSLGPCRPNHTAERQHHRDAARGGGEVEGRQHRVAIRFIGRRDLRMDSCGGEV